MDRKGREADAGVWGMQLDGIMHIIEERLTEMQSRIMVGDKVVGYQDAVSTAMMAANMAAHITANSVVTPRRFDLCCRIAGDLMANSEHVMKGTAAELAIALVDEVEKKLAAWANEERNEGE